MRYEIILSPEAIEDLGRLKTPQRSAVRDALEQHLRYEPTRLSRSRIKRLRGLAQPQFRLRVGGIRVFYDLLESTVQVLAIILKSDAETWLRERGVIDEKGAVDGSEE